MKPAFYAANSRAGVKQWKTYRCPFLLARWRGVWGKTMSGVVRWISIGSVLTSNWTVSNLKNDLKTKINKPKRERERKTPTYRPYWAANSSAVSPLEFLIPGSQFFSNKALTTSVWPNWAAQWRAVSSSLVCPPKKKKKTNKTPESYPLLHEYVNPQNLKVSPSFWTLRNFVKGNLKGDHRKFANLA